TATAKRCDSAPGGSRSNRAKRSSTRSEVSSARTRSATSRWGDRMANAYTLDFEKPLLELERQIEELKRVGEERQIDVAEELGLLQGKLDALREDIYRNLTPMQRVSVARHPRRPYTLDYLGSIFTDFVELHGDRLYRDDLAVVGGAGHQPARDGDARHPHPRGGDRRGRLRRRAGAGTRRPGPDVRELGLLGDLARGLRGDPLEGRQPAGARRRGAQAHRRRPAA